MLSKAKTLSIIILILKYKCLLFTKRSLEWPLIFCYFRTVGIKTFLILALMKHCLKAENFVLLKIAAR